MDFSNFKRDLRTNQVAVLSAEVPSDLLTPASVYLALSAESTAPAFLFESVEGGESIGRYSFIGIDPIEEIQLGEIGGIHRIGRRRETFPVGELFDRIRSRLFNAGRRGAADRSEGMTGGWIGYFAYDCVRLFERLPVHVPDTLGHPWLSLGLFDSIVVFDHARQTARATVTVFPELFRGQTAERAYARAQRRLGRMVRLLNRPLSRTGLSPLHEQSVTSNTPRRRFAESVKTVKKHIARGDIFQGVLSQRFSVEGQVAPFDVYRRLRRSNPSPYMYFLRFADLAIAGSSPETLVQLRGNQISTRPIAGTRPRGATHKDDQRLERNLKASPKENAEHVMLVDLGRNDLGRVCRPGSVVTDNFCSIERFSHVMHIVSNVTGRKRPGIDALDVLAATFPAGTVSGAPKIRAMEIIESVEPDRRGVYAGSVGYIDWNGDMDMAIAIRTAVMDARGAYVQAGAGIVADSDPEREYRETQNKAAAPLAAVGGVWPRGNRP
jgi:anthranilate synthase component 1